jgi:hypothetical protein
MMEWVRGFPDALLHPINPSVVILLGAYTILWGFWVANPFWAVFPLSPLYDALAATSFFITPELWWGGLAIITGTVTSYGALRRKYKPLTRGAMVQFLFWVTICIFYLIGDWHSTGGITAGLLWVYSAYIYLNIRVNHKKTPVPPDLFHEGGHHCSECA